MERRRGWEAAASPEARIPLGFGDSEFREGNLDREEPYPKWEPCERTRSWRRWCLPHHVQSPAAPDSTRGQTEERESELNGTWFEFHFHLAVT